MLGAAQRGWVAGHPDYAARLRCNAHSTRPALPSRRHALLRCAALQSILTGESGSVDKSPEVVDTAKAVVQDKTNMLFSVGGVGVG